MAEPVETENAGESAPRKSWGLVLGLLLFALLLLLVRVRQEPPAPVGADAPAADFSGVRAQALLRTLLGDGSPHPVGSPANDRVRERILTELQRLGYEPEVQEGFSCSPGGFCARVKNVIAFLPGADKLPSGTPNAILLAAHYDSVPAGPGAGDDLSGVAVLLEVARALKAGPPPRHPVIFLLDDGEEAGLLGAQLFDARHPASKDVRVVLNFEARGTAGPSLMFETSGHDQWLVEHYSAAVSHPATSSLYATVYEQMPNDTDLSIFKRRDVDGLNFAFVGNPTHYHTSEDNFENVSPASLQHHGGNALATARSLADSSVLSPPAEDAVFFDVLSLGVVRWPQSWTPILALIALVGIVAATVHVLRRGSVPKQALLWGLLGFLGIVVAAALLAVGLFLVLRGAFPFPWVASPQPEIAAFWLLGIATAALVAGLLSRRAGATGLWAGVWIAWAVLGLVLSLVAPGVSYLFLVPALVAGIAGPVFPSRGTLACLIPALTAALLWFPIVTPLYDGLGSPALVVVGVLVALLFTTFAPLVPASGSLGGRWLPVAGFTLALIGAGLAFASAPYSERSPQHSSIQFFQDAGTGQAQWLVQGPLPLPQGLREAGRFGSEREPAYPWTTSQYRLFKAPAPRMSLPGPQIAVLSNSVSGSQRRLRLRLTSSRPAFQMALLLPAEAKLVSAKVHGEEIPFDRRRQRAPASWQSIGTETMPPEGVEVELVLGETRPLEWWVYDLSAGVPPAGEALLRARPTTAVPFQDGDTTMVARKIRI
jgi:hypothetical protein